MGSASDRVRGPITLNPFSDMMTRDMHSLMVVTVLALPVGCSTQQAQVPWLNPKAQKVHANIPKLAEGMRQEQVLSTLGLEEDLPMGSFGCLHHNTTIYRLSDGSTVYLSFRPHYEGDDQWSWSFTGVQIQRSDTGEEVAAEPSDGSDAATPGEGKGRETE